MTIKTCTCGHKIQTKKAKVIGVSEMGKKRMLWVNCPACGSTAVILAPLKRITA